MSKARKSRASAPTNLNDSRPHAASAAAATAAAIASSEDEPGMAMVDAVDTNSSPHTCFFNHLDSELLRILIERPPDALVGCVAWMTHPDILQHLIDTRTPCSIIVQKERSLQPSKIRNKQSAVFFAAQKLRRLYDQVTPLPWHEQAFRCVGIAGSKTSINPIMHHKFLIFLYRLPSVTISVAAAAAAAAASSTPPLSSWEQLTAQAVWNGSWNVSRNGTRGFDNATFSTDARVASAFLHEAHFVHSQSESLDWTSRTSKPTVGKASAAASTQK
jgi:hypothetical protein